MSQRNVYERCPECFGADYEPYKWGTRTIFQEHNMRQSRAQKKKLLSTCEINILVIQAL